MRLFSNIMKLTDSYKQSHWKQYPPGTQTVFSYFESRGGKWDRVTFFGLQYFIKQYLEGEVVTQEKIDAAERTVNRHMGEGTFNREGWEYILRVHKGRLPVRIRAVPEGSIIPGRHVMMTIENTDPACFWLTNFLETLLVQVWYPCTVATQSREMKQIIYDSLVETGDENNIDFKLHDFGFRGVSSVETAGIGGCAHLLYFKGTDTMPALEVAEECYGCDMAGYSVPASEHSTITSWGKDHEADAMANMLDRYPTGLVACVSDSYDIYGACRDIWGTKLRDRILNRDGVLVVRPDSGYPPDVVCNVFDILYEKFGGQRNSKGYRVLDPHIRVIQGDGIDFDMLQSILIQTKYKNWSTDNLTFGSGGGLLQKHNRDTLKFAFKCSAMMKYGEWYDVYKDPVTDQGKESKKGRLELVRYRGAHGIGYVTQKDTDPMLGGENVLRTVFFNGQVIREYKFDDIRTTASH